MSRSLKETYRVNVLRTDGAPDSAEIEWWSEASESGSGWPDYHVRIDLAETSSDGVGSDVFEAFQNARVDLEALGYRFLCYGAGLGVWPSGMARDMGEGRKAYRLSQDRPPTGDDLVGIFDTGEDVEPCTVREQCAFADEWLRDSERRNRVHQGGFWSRTAAAIRRAFRWAASR